MYFSIDTASTAIGMNACQTIIHIVNKRYMYGLYYRIGLAKRVRIVAEDMYPADNLIVSCKYVYTANLYSYDK